MRAAIIKELKKISDFQNRVYQAYTAPTNVAKPYCTVKLSGEYPNATNKKGSNIELQIFIYNSPSSFTNLDILEKKVRSQLHEVILSTDESPARHFTCIYTMTQPDYFDDVSQLFMKRIDFIIPLSRI